MKTHVVINNVDFTPYVIDGSYKVESADTYESWIDGNYKEHRIIISSKVSGSFQIACGGSLTLSNFLAALSAATSNGVLTIRLYVPNKNETKNLQCYCEVENEGHILTAGGNWIDKLTIKIKER